MGDAKDVRVRGTLNELAQRIHENAVAKGFHDPPRRLPELLTLAHSELSEAFEAWRDNGYAVFYQNEGGEVREGWAVELIDCIIVCLDILAAEGLPIDALMEQKLARNEARPLRHGRRI